MKTLTGRQRKVLDFVEGFRSRTGYPPTLQEIGDTILLAGMSTDPKLTQTTRNRKNGASNEISEEAAHVA